MHVHAIRQALHQQPFQPFRLVLVNGREFVIPHPDFVALTDRAVVVMNSVDDHLSILEPGLILSLEGMTAPPTGNQKATP